MAKLPERRVSQHRVAYQHDLHGGVLPKHQYPTIQLSMSELEQAEDFLSRTPAKLKEKIADISRPSDNKIFEIYHGLQVHALLYYLRTAFRASVETSPQSPATLLDYAGSMDDQRLAVEKWITETTYVHRQMTDPAEIGWQAFLYWRDAQEFRVWDDPHAWKHRVLIYPRAYPRGLRENIWYSSEMLFDLQTNHSRYVKLAAEGLLRELDTTKVQAFYEQRRLHKIKFSNDVMASVLIASDALYLDQDYGLIDADIKQNEGQSIEEMTLTQRMQLTLREITAPSALFRLRQLQARLDRHEKKEYDSEPLRLGAERKIRKLPKDEIHVNSNLKIDFPDYEGYFEQEVDLRRLHVSIINQFPAYTGDHGFYSENLTPSADQHEIDLYNLQQAYTLLADENGARYNQVRQYIDAKKERTRGLSPMISLARLEQKVSDSHYQRAAFLPYQPAILLTKRSHRHQKKHA